MTRHEERRGPERGLTIDDVRFSMLHASGRLPSTRIGVDDGRLPGYDNVACLLKEPDGTWMVAWFERGAYQDRETYETEHAACAAFLELIGVGVEASDT
jgi:hypothetical protein